MTSMEAPTPIRPRTAVGDLTTTLHLLMATPRIEFSGGTYPSMDVYCDEPHANFYVSLTGTAEERHAAAEQLRAVADGIDAWVDPYLLPAALAQPSEAPR